MKRPDGTEQLTYKGAPVYTFAPDKKAGEVGGQGVKDVGTWTAVTTSTQQHRRFDQQPARARRPGELGRRLWPTDREHARRA